MKIRILLSPSQLRQWHLKLATALSFKGYRVAFAFVEGGQTLPAVYLIWLEMERVIYRLLPDHLSRRIDVAQIAQFPDDQLQPGCVIDLTGTNTEAGRRTATPSFVMLFDECPSETAAISRIIRGEVPFLSVRNAEGDEIMGGLPAIEKPHSLAQAMDHVFARCITLLLKAVAGHARPVVDPMAAHKTGTEVSSRMILSFALKSLIGRIARKAGLAAAPPEAWQVGWRSLDRQPQMDEFHWLRDDGQRYYADPFPFDFKSKTYVFCEEYPLESRKGLISVFDINAEGLAASPARVLERPYHLSYPSVFEHDGHIWMIPETFANRSIELYRAKRFPHEWELECVLVDGVEASDATLLEYEGKYWLFATIAEGGSTWDCLAIWSASSLKGPWMPHAQNPVLIDSRIARPAGRFIKRDGKVLRPVQNCERHYGDGVTMREIVRLDEDHFEERRIDDAVTGMVMPEGHVHTFNLSRRFELIDRLQPAHQGGVIPASD